MERYLVALESQASCLFLNSFFTAGYIRLVRQPGWLPHKSCSFSSDHLIKWSDCKTAIFIRKLFRN
jgi:hypothetical protein